MSKKLRIIAFLQVKHENIITQTKLRGIEIEIPRRDDESANLVRHNGLAPELCWEQRLRTGDALVRTAVVGICRRAGLEVAVCRLWWMAEVSWWTAPGVVLRKRSGGRVCRVGDEAGAEG